MSTEVDFHIMDHSKQRESEMENVCIYSLGIVVTGM